MNARPKLFNNLLKYKYQKMKQLLPAIIIILILAVVGFIGWSLISKKQPAQTTGAGQTQTALESGQFTFETPKKSAHYESNTPAHGTTLAGVPTNVVVDFNFDLAPPSQITIKKDGKDYGMGETVIDDNKLAMRKNMEPSSPDGLYTVSYNACWPDGSCHDGNFQFKIDRSKSGGFEDLTGQSEVTVKLSQIMFGPQNIKISKGTKVTWVNNDSVEHYINTDSHPAHTYFPKQNSKALKGGNTYSLTFETAGIYPYHCSAHAQTMTGSILVE